MIPAVVIPRTVVLPLEAYGWSVTVWEELTHGQYNAMRSRVYTEADGGALLKPDPLRFYDGLVVAYLVDWTLTDAQGQRIEIRGLKPEALQDALGNLRQFAALEVQRAIEAHHERVSAAIADLKKTASTAPPSATISPYVGSPA
jgi:hypothetical protein